MRLPPAWPGFSKERNTSSSFGGEYLSAGSRRVCSCPPSGCLTALGPLARVAVRRYRSHMQGLVGLILGWDHTAIVKVRVSWAKSSIGVLLLLERKSSVRAQPPLALILSRWGHTTHFDRLAQHHLLGSSCWVFLLFFIFFGILMDVLPRSCFPATHLQWGWWRWASASGSMEPLSCALGKQNKPQVLPVFLAQWPRSALLPVTPPCGST